MMFQLVHSHQQLAFSRLDGLDLLEQKGAGPASLIVAKRLAFVTQLLIFTLQLSPLVGDLALEVGAGGRDHLSKLLVKTI